MSKLIKTPVLRLICVGGAKAATNGVGAELPEIDGSPGKFDL